MIAVSLDISTKFLAYATWSGSELHNYGKVYAVGVGDVGIASYTKGVMHAFEHLDVDVVVYESAFLGANANVMKQLSKSTGATIGGFHVLGVREFASVPPITWQTGIGVGKTPYGEKQNLKKKYPGKGVTWLRNKDRENRKQKVIDFVNTTFDKNFTMEDNDIADAIAIGYYSQNLWSGR